jgi:hypothetical protein
MIKVREKDWFYLFLLLLYYIILYYIILYYIILYYIILYYIILYYIILYYIILLCLKLRVYFYKKWSSIGLRIYYSDNLARVIKLDLNPSFQCVFRNVAPKSKVVYRNHYRNFALCRVPHSLPSIVFRTLGKEALCRVPRKKPSTK